MMNEIKNKKNNRNQSDPTFITCDTDHANGIEKQLTQ